MATSKIEPEKEFDDIIAYIQQVHDRWYVMAYPGRTAPEPEAAHVAAAAQQSAAAPAQQMAQAE